MKNNKCIVILSHSSYSDVWDILIDSYIKYFKEDGFDFFISSDIAPDEHEKKAISNGFKMIHYEKNITWGRSLKQTINFLLKDDYKCVIFSFDDLVLLKPISRPILPLINLMESNNVNYLQLKNGYRSFFSFESLFFNDTFHKVSNNDSYKGSLVFSVLREDLLRKLIDIDSLDNYNPWQYEANIHNFLKAEDFYCLPKSIIRFSNLIIKGKVDPIQLKFVEKNNHIKYLGRRNQMNFKETLFFQIKYILFYSIKNILPKHFFSKIRELKNKL
jgi:hypothetical protein